MTGLILRIRLHDERALEALVLRRRPALDRVMRRVTRLADAPVAIAVAAALALGVVPSLRAAGEEAAFALAASHALVQLLKRGIARPRPRLPVGILSLVEAPDRFSFPSGHAAASLSVVLPLAMVLPGAVGALLLLLAGWVGLSRCYLGVHYPGDVLAGWALAATGYLLAGWVLG
jgi:undecaprenyl-diphosphatase